MAAAWVIVAALVAVARSQWVSPWQTRNGQLVPSSPKAIYFTDETNPAQATLFQASPQWLSWAKSPINTLNTQQVKWINTRNGLKAINAEYVQPGAFEDAIAVQASLKNLPTSQSPLFTAIPEGPSSRFINPQQLRQASPMATLALLDDGTPVAVVSASAKSPVLAWNPQSPAARFITPQQAINQYAEASAYFPEEEAPVAVIPVQPKSFEPAQPSVFIIPLESSVKITNQQYLAQNPDAQSSPFYLEDESPIAVVPGQTNHFQLDQPQVFAAIPREASVKFANHPQYLAPVPTLAAAGPKLYDAPATRLVPLRHPALAKHQPW